jgi:hypothetical protein
MVLDRTGRVEVRPADSPGAAQPVRAGDLLYPGERIAVPAGGSAVLAVLGVGARERLKPGSEATVGPAGCAPPEAVLERAPQKPAVAASLKGVRPAAGDGRNAGVLFRGDDDLPDPPPPVTPLYGATVPTDRPSLAWRPFEGVARYRVRLLTASGRELWRAETDATRLPYPADKPGLRPGYVYDWEVADAAEARPLARSRLSVALESDRPKFDELKSLAAGDDRAGVLEAALGYARLHAWDEALSTYERLAKLAPDEPAFRRALADLYRRAGRPDDAKSAERGRDTR